MTKWQEDNSVKLQEALADNVTLRASNSALSDQLARLEQDHRALSEESSAQGVRNPIDADITWQYCVNPDWIDMPADCSLELTRQHLAGTRGGGNLVRKFNYRSCAQLYEFDFLSMQQQNVKTRTQRAIRCVVNCPSHWTRCTSIGDIHSASTAQSKTVELSGLTHSEMNGVYVESAYDSNNGKPIWWKHDGTHLLLWRRKYDAWLLSTVTSDYLKHRNGSSMAQVYTRGWQNDCDCKSEYDGEWMETDANREWKINHNVRVRLLTLENTMPPLMNIVVELLDKPTREWFHTLLRGTVYHHQEHLGTSPCNDLKEQFKIVRVLRVENWHLLQKYRNHVHQMKQDLAKYRIKPGVVEPRLPDLLNEMLEYYGGGDPEINECFLFHGTSPQTATCIAQEGFDFRMARAGYYGRGTYFASQSCKSFQYTGDGDVDLRTLIVSRVALGDISYATKVDRECQRPDIREGTLICHDSIVANPGPMCGHMQGQQSHQEFVIFDKFQAYPEFLVQFTCRT